MNPGQLIPRLFVSVVGFAIALFCVGLGWKYLDEVLVYVPQDVRENLIKVAQCLVGTYVGVFLFIGSPHKES